MTDARGREARLRQGFAYLYPGIPVDTWMPVEKLLHDVVTMIYGDKSKSGVITGDRLLREDHFEFRGASPRPEGWPEHLSRLSDAAADPRKKRKKPK